MRYLAPEYWRSFQKPDGRFDGVKFEELVATLLPIIYPGEWTRTKYSWDGKKDFYQQSGGERRWAECKAYKEPISINIVSPTLIMALIDNARVILLFSYSKINKNAHLYLGQFATLTSRTVRVFDDETLEGLILRHAQLARFFPGVSSIELPPVRNIEAHARLSQDPDIEYQAEGVIDSDNRDIYLSLLSTFSVDVLVQNRGTAMNAVSGVISLDLDDLVERYWLFNQDMSRTAPSVSFNLESGESFFQRFYFRARQPGKMAAPKVTVKVDGQEPNVLSLDSINVSSILAVPLIGRKQNAALATFCHRVSARDKPIFCHLYGRSGTGKSRLLREFRDELLGRGFSIFVFNGENERNSSFDHFVKRLASAISKLPTLDHVVRPTAADIGFGTGGSGQALLDLLYCESLRPSSKPADAIRTILSLLASRRVAILVDNTQFLDANTIDLINTAITETAGTASRNIWVLSLNTEVVTSEMPAANLSSRLRSLAADDPDTFFAESVDGFTYEDARLYLDEALAGVPSESGERFTVKYPDTAALIIDRAGTQPLFLEQTLQHAVDRGGLDRRGGRLVVTDIEEFHYAINALPGRIRELIAKRWEFVSARLTGESVLLVQSLAELVSMPMAATRSLGLQRKDILPLVTLGIVDITESNEVRFHHRQHYLFFASLYNEATFSLAHRLLQVIGSPEYSDQYPFQLITIRDRVGELTDQDLQTISGIIVKKTIMGAARLRATPLMLEIFNRPNLPVDPGIELRVVNTLCQEVKRHVAFENAATAFEKAYSIRLARRHRYLRYGEEYHGFVHDYANSFFALHRDGEALPLLESSLRDFPSFQFSTETSRLLARGKLLNRLCVALKTVHDLSAAEQTVKESLGIAESIHDLRLVYKNYIDWGYIYHGFKKHNDDLVLKWNAAIKIFQQGAAMDASMLDERASYLLHSAELQILACDQGAIETINEGIRYSRRTLTPFHEVKLLLLRVVAEWVSGTGEDSRNLVRWLDQAEDRAVATRTQRSYWVVFYARATLAWKAGDHEQSATHFLTALEQLAKILTDPRMEERHEPFFEDLAIHLRLAGRPLPQQNLSLIRNARIQDLVQTILQMRRSAFDEWLSHYVPTATFHDAHFNLPVP
jgi:tetratricopeptide (TPR) repeat protein